MMSSRNATLVDCDDSLQWLMQFLRDLDTDFASLLFNSLHKRISYRRNGTLIGLMRYLEDPRVLYDYNVESFDGLFEMPSRT